MSIRSLVLIVLAMCCVAPCGYGMREEQAGPDSERGHMTADQPDWPIGIVALPRHPARVYSWDVNGSEQFCFQATVAQVNELIDLFSKARMRDHELWIKPGIGESRSFDGKLYPHNVSLRVMGAIELFTMRKSAPEHTYDPVLTVYAGPDEDKFLEQVQIPDNIILQNELPGSTLTSACTKPARSAWYARVGFEDGSTVADADYSLFTHVTLWEREADSGIRLGTVKRDGSFSVALSDGELAALETGRAWLTITAGNQFVVPSPNDARLGVEHLTQDKADAQPVTVVKPEPLYGRILLEDGTSPVKSAVRFPDSPYWIEIPYAFPAVPDGEGFFQVYLSQDQVQSAAAMEHPARIYVPSGRAGGGWKNGGEYPVAKLSPNKDEAGVVYLPNSVSK